MPPVSKAQARYLWAKVPKVAKKWAAEGEMKLPKNLPEHVADRGRAINAHVRRGQAWKSK